MSLKEMRKNAGLTQPQVAELAEINLNMLKFYEQGVKDINGAKLKTLLKICKVLNCGLQDIVTDEETLELLDELNY